MTLAQAETYAQKIAEWLAPFCERMMIAGSIRRRRPVCNDIDLVVIPRYVSVQVDMFATERHSVLRTELVNYVRHSDGKSRWLGRQPQRVAGVAMEPEIAGSEPKMDAMNLLVQLPKVQLDIFCARADTWATLLLCRTGSREHNIFFANYAKERGGHWNPYKGLTLNGDLVPAKTEEDLYAALGVPYLDPPDREPMPGGYIP